MKIRAKSKWLICVCITQEHINATTDPKHYKIIISKNTTKLTLMNLTEEDSGKYTCSAVFEIKPTESHLELKVLSFTEPLKPFLVIAAEVVILVTLILLYERYSKKREDPAETTGRLKRHSDSVCSVHREQNAWENMYFFCMLYIEHCCLLSTSQITECMKIRREYNSVCMWLSVCLTQC